MTRVRWSATAQNDLRNIHSYIARDSSTYASRFVDRIREAIDNVRIFPEAGSRVPE